MNHAERMMRFYEADLYVVITESFCKGRSSLEVLDQVLDAGVRLVQFREKDHDAAELKEKALAFKERVSAVNGVLIINDDVELALEIDAEGVHLGQGDMPVEEARKMSSDLIIGASTHSHEQAMAAQRAGASYVNIGPIFETSTKTSQVEPLGPEILEGLPELFLIPFTTMGGIKLHNVDEVLKRGARFPAVVTAVTAADDPKAAAAALRKKIRSGVTPETTKVGGRYRMLP